MNRDRFELGAAFVITGAWIVLVGLGLLICLGVGFILIIGQFGLLA